MPRHHEHGRRALLPRGLWGLIGQAANSGGNLALAIMVARSARAEEFGAWSLGYALLVVSLGAARAVVGTPLLLKSQEPQLLAPSTGGALAVSIALSTPAVTLVALLAVVIETGRGGLLALAVVLPAMLVQDGVRHIYFSRDQPQIAAACDAAWLVLQVAGFGLLVALGEQNAASLTLMWGLTALASVLPSLAILRGTLPSPRAGRAFVRENGRAMRTLAIDYIVVACSVQAVPYVLALVAGLEATGGLRGAQILMGPVNVLIMGLTPIFTVDARRRASNGQLLDSLVHRWSALVATLSLLYGGVLLVLPASIGRELLGPTWVIASPLFAALVIQAVLSGPVTGVQVALRGLDRLRDGLSLRIRTSIPMLGIPVLGVIVAAEQGAAWGFACGTAVAIVQSMRELRRGRGDDASTARQTHHG